MYQISKAQAFWFQISRVLKVSLYVYVMPAPGQQLENLGRGPLDEAMYQISKAQAFWFQISRFLKVSLYKYM